MPLSPDPVITIDTDRLNGMLTDDTVFGGSNPARNTVLVFLSGYKVAYDNSTTALTVTGNDGTPVTDSSWRFNIPLDGGYKFYYVIVEDEYDGGTTYNIYDAVYDGILVYRSLINSNVGNSLTDTDFWEPILDPSILANNKDTATESENITSLVYLRTLFPNSQYTFANRVSDQCACTDCAESETLNDYTIFRMWLDDADIADSRSEILDGEEICRRIQSRFIDC